MERSCRFVNATAIVKSVHAGTSLPEKLQKLIYNNIVPWSTKKKVQSKYVFCRPI